MNVRVCLFYQHAQDLVSDVLHHLEMLSHHIGATAADVLNRMKTARLLEVMGEDHPARVARIVGQRISQPDAPPAPRPASGGRA